MEPQARNSKLEPDELAHRARRLKLLLMDCDGVMTDGRITLLADGDERKTFHVHDGQGIALLQREGLQTGIISGRASTATERRANELKMKYVRQNVRDKVSAFEEILTEAAISADEAGYIGDDVADIPVMSRAGLAVAVADAADETKRAAHYVTTRKGGHGAVREAIDLILKARR